MKKQEISNTGINLKSPAKSCDDKHCPFHKGLKIRGNFFTGKVTKISSQKTAHVEFPRLFYLQKYERFEKRRSRIHVHSTPCIDIKVGDTVKIMECLQISKMKNFVIIENESA